MNKKNFLIGTGAVLVLAVLIGTSAWSNNSAKLASRVNPTLNALSGTSTTSTALMAGGCFWCVEADFEKLPGVINVVSGYSGGTGDSPTYDDYAERGYREVVEITYNPEIVNYSGLVEYLIKHGDPTDAGGSFYDRGPQYAPAVYYSSELERAQAQQVIVEIEGKKVYDKPLALVVLPVVKFWPAEDYHQDYYKKNPIRYAYYRNASGRDAFVKAHWGDNVLPRQTTETTRGFVKPSETELRAKLTPLQYAVTQEGETEPPFDNEYNANKEKGIYVDIVSGEALYSSLDKYDSGTGWPSFVKPITPTAVVEVVDKGFFTTAVEIRSRLADSHLGHVFDDGPADRGGKRYCMNSAALRFVPVANLEKEGYGEYMALFK